MNTRTFRLVLFVKDSSEKHKPTLMQILFAIFISIYVDMLVGGLKQAGKLTLCQSELLNNKYLFASNFQALPACCTSMLYILHALFVYFNNTDFCSSLSTVIFPDIAMLCFWGLLASKPKFVVNEPAWLKFISPADVFVKWRWWIWFFCCRILLLLSLQSICGRFWKTLAIIWLVYITTILNLCKRDKTHCLSISFSVEISF